MTRIKDYAFLHFIVLIWGFTAILGSLITIPAVELVFYRTLIAFLCIAGILLFQKKTFGVGSFNALKFILTGFLISLHWILFFGAARVSSASVCLAGMSTCALWTSILEPLMTKKKFQVIDILLAVTVIVGLYIIFQFEFEQSLGLVMAIGSALLASFFTIFNSGFTQNHDPLVIDFYEMMGAFVCTALFLPFYQFYITEGAVSLMPVGMDWVYIFILATLCTVYAFTKSIELMKRISAFAVNLTVNLEPVYGMFLAYVIIGEKMTPGFYLGAFIILISVFAYPAIKIIRNRSAKKSLAN